MGPASDRSLTWRGFGSIVVGAAVVVALAVPGAVATVVEVAAVPAHLLQIVRKLAQAAKRVAPFHLEVAEPASLRVALALEALVPQLAGRLEVAAVAVQVTAIDEQLALHAADMALVAAVFPVVAPGAVVVAVVAVAISIAVAGIGLGGSEHRYGQEIGRAHV